MTLSKELKIRITFALTMGLFTTGVITFIVIAINFGFVPAFMNVWVKSWLIAYVVVIPIIIFIGPQVQKRIAAFFANG